MPTTFIKSQNVGVKTSVPQGPVLALRMNEDGKFFYLIEWTDTNGKTQRRWFEESTLEAA